MKTIGLPLLLLSFLGTAASHAADSWGIDGEEKARIQATVVDVLCEVTGQCTDNCGNGKRQLGLLQDDGTLVLPIKNNDIFAGAVADLAPFCGKRIEADGLLIKKDQITMFALQFKRELPDGKWSRANWFTRDWAQRTGMDADRWFEKDPTIKAELERAGILGLPGVTYVPD
jgi:hypothetical protein